MHPILQKTLSALDGSIAGLDAAALSRHLQGKWCVAEVLEHLLLAYTGTVKAFERAAAGQALPLPAPTLRERLFVLVVCGMEYMPSGRKAPAGVVPKGRPAQEVATEVRGMMIRMDQAITDYEQQHGSQPVGPHPVLGPLTPAQWRTFHWVHTRHHLGQIQRLRAWMDSAPAASGAPTTP